MSSTFAGPTTVSGMYDLAQAALSVAETALATTVGGSPERAFVSPSRPPWDCCPFVAVWTPRIGEESTSPFSPPAATGNRQRYGRINLVTLNVTVVRCNPWDGVNLAPPADDIELVAQQTMEDGWALWCGFHNALQDGTFLSLCDDVHFDAGQAMEQQGQAVGWQFVMRANLGGIRGS